ncbi:hypothetical protein CEP51_010870 [Fusarium floridanum]|uniref:Zn(2)-C6 fungal-type domain-containing protein n=1 Tax=Fusarium floridanum TaxID=1325733 RepID=A0A428RD17_9HYPO|nr:hypothetical protein CEP51_010870 [Fusarium floridanum]
MHAKVSAADFSPMSLTARERRNPPPRRKSCAACTKAKRRCDFAAPACLRCSQRCIPCHYPSRTPRGQTTTTSSSSPETIMPGLLTNESASSTPPAVGQLDEPIVDDFNAVIADIDTNFNELASFDVPLDDATLDLIQPSLELLPPSTREFGAIPEAITGRLKFSIAEIQKAPSTMVLENQTPWCHALLYKNEMPRSMQGKVHLSSVGDSLTLSADAHAACALYLAKNRVNSPFIFRSIETRVNDLLSSPPPITPLECLAHTQALILYQIIRLFDGDIGARASAERMIPAIESSAMSLFSHVQYDLDGTSTRSLPLFPIAPAKTFWMDWILQESLRRTLLFTFYFMQIYRIMAGYRGLQCDGRMGLCHSWTLSAHLWNARSPLAFAEAWTNKKHLVVTDALFGKVLQEAMAHDVDVLGRIFISSLLGVDEAEGWFASRGGKL